MAGRLGISASYLNLIENDRRPLTPALLGRLVEVYGVDEQVFLAEAPARLRADLAAVIDDPLYPGPRLGARELTDLAATLPKAGRALLTLYRAYLAALSEARGLGERLAGDPFLAAARHRLLTRLTSVRSYSEILRDNVDLAVSRRQRFIDVLVDESEQLTDLVDEVFDFLAADGALGRVHQDSPPESPSDSAVALVAELIRAHNNHFPDLEDAADALEADALGHGLAATFEAARQQALLSCGPAIDARVAEAGALPPTAAALYRRVLGNYVAAAMIMPYAPFRQAAADLRYDLELLQHRFGVSFEQVCHRLTTLQRPGVEGVPFHFVRVDIAGNVVKSFSASGLHIPRYGGLCPRWNAHLAFLSPGRIDTQVVQFPDGDRYLFIARAMSRAPGGQGAPRSHYAVAIGCDISFAPRLVYADGLVTDGPAHDVPVGLSCRQCPRRDCAQRAAPSFARSPTGIWPMTTAPGPQ